MDGWGLGAGGFYEVLCTFGRLMDGGGGGTGFEDGLGFLYFFSIFTSFLQHRMRMNMEKERKEPALDAGVLLGFGDFLRGVFVKRTSCG